MLYFLPVSALKEKCPSISVFTNPVPAPPNLMVTPASPSFLLLETLPATFPFWANSGVDKNPRMTNKTIFFTQYILMEQRCRGHVTKLLPQGYLLVNKTLENGKSLGILEAV